MIRILNFDGDDISFFSLRKQHFNSGLTRLISEQFTAASFRNKWLRLRTWWFIFQCTPEEEKVAFRYDDDLMTSIWFLEKKSKK